MADEIIKISRFRKMLEENPKLEDLIDEMAELIVEINTIDAEDKK
jgi:hypothetical protein